MARKRLIPAVNDALVAEMERDEKLIVFGEDVELAIMGDTRGLVGRFGRDRVRNSPICEQTLTGMAVGLASAGYRVVLHLMFNNFIYTGMDAIGNQMAKLRLMTGGQMELPITVIAGYGGGNSNAAQHSDTAYPALMNLGGLRVAVPTNSADAKGLFTTAVRGRTPTFFLEAAGRGGTRRRRRSRAPFRPSHGRAVGWDQDCVTHRLPDATQPENFLPRSRVGQRNVSGRPTRCCVDRRRSALNPV